jgi:hypothetical protein
LFGFVVVLALIGFFGWAVVRGVEEDPSVVGSFAVAGGAVVVAVWGRQREKQLELLQSHRERMAPIYEELFDRFREADDEIAGREVPSEEFYADLHKKLVLYGPTPVVQEWLRWARTPAPENFDFEGDPTILLRWERVLFAIRKDLGHDNSGLAPGDILRIWVHDSDEAVKPWLDAGGRF